MRGFKEVMNGAEQAISKLNLIKNLNKAPLDRVTIEQARAMLGEEFNEWLFSVDYDDELQELADVIACASILVTRLMEQKQWKTQKNLNE